MKKILLIACVAVATMMASCSKEGANLTKSGLNPADFSYVTDGDTTALYTLTNKNGMEVCVTNFGARIVSIMVPDKQGKMTDVVLGYDSIGKYINNQSDFGAAIGRYANRINKGQITVEGKKIQLPINNYGHCLHGGPKGWQYKVYKANQINDHTLQLTLNSPDGDQNFPGNVKAIVTYKLTDDNTIDIKYEATTDKETVINMTNHSYFNLNGDPTIPVTNDTLFVNAKAFTPVDSTFMTTGQIASVYDTPFDFITKPMTIGARIDSDNQQLKNGHGYDHNWVLNTAGDISRIAARVVSPITGIVLEVCTDQPGIQIYTGNFLDGTQVGKKGIKYGHRTAICLETQVYPDSPNKKGRPGWPNAYLKPGEKYTHETLFHFSVEK
ncbi:MAG: galactose mutarotase [Prevotellaceae bacterium]|nr:galactose mutarotase [Prevotellaceae bacterium]MDY3857114.1 aldose epimerase family protein [Bacteroidaceae bacterium]